MATLVRRLRLKWVEHAYPNELYLERMLRLANLLDESEYKHIKYDLNRACTFQIEGVYLKLEIYIEKISQLIHWITTDSTVPSNWHKHDLQSTTVNSLLISATNKAINRPILIKKFKEIVIEYLNILIKIKTSNEQLYYIRILMGFNEHLNELLLNLLRFTIQ